MSFFLCFRGAHIIVCVAQQAHRSGHRTGLLVIQVPSVCVGIYVGGDNGVYEMEERYEWVLLDMDPCLSM